MKRLILGILVAFSVVSVSFGAWIPEDDEANYQKLKAEVEMWKGKECKYNESGKLVDGDIMCDAKNVIAFFDEIRATEIKDNELKNKFDSTFDIAVRKVREMPRFKNDSGIYTYARGAYFNKENFWENVWQEWDKTKLNLEIRGIKGEYWKAVAEESK